MTCLNSPFKSRDEMKEAMLNGLASILTIDEYRKMSHLFATMPDSVFDQIAAECAESVKRKGVSYKELVKKRAEFKGKVTKKTRKSKKTEKICVIYRFFCTFAPDMDYQEKTNAQFEQALAECRALFEKKLHDYKASWRILRPTALTDQLFIKAKRIRSLEIKQESMVGEGIRPEFIALINYGIVGLIQLSKGFADTVDMDNDEAMRLYDQYAHEALELMKRKNHDYDEAWRSMRVSSYTDLILTKIERIKEIENLGGETLVSEGIDANYMDIINYAVFGVIKLSE